MSNHACDQCGFLVDDYSDRDLRTAPSWLAAMTAQTVAPVDDGVLGQPAIRTTIEDLRAIVAGLETDVEGGRAEPDRVHAGVHGLRQLGRQLHEAGAGAPTQQGTVAQVSASNGGVPKRAVDTADVGRRGLVGDRQDNRTHHGRPFQALCLWSVEVIDALAAEGHPIGPGAAGENLTVAGIDWTTLRPGVRLLVGDVTCELSAWAVPCRKNDRWFNGSSDRIDHDLHPGWSRAYAWVLEPGTVTTGDHVTVEP